MSKNQKEEMNKITEALEQLRLDNIELKKANNNLITSVEELQTRAGSSQPVTSQKSHLKAKICLPEKFDGSRHLFR